MSKERMIAIAKRRTTTDRWLGEVANTLDYSDAELAVAIAENPNVSNNTIATLLNKDFYDVGVTLTLIEKLTSIDGIEEAIDSFVAKFMTNAFDWWSGDWEQVRRALADGACATYLEENFLYIELWEYPGNSLDDDDWDYDDDYDDSWGYND